MKPSRNPLRYWKGGNTIRLYFEPAATTRGRSLWLEPCPRTGWKIDSRDAMGESEQMPPELVASYREMLLGHIEEATAKASELVTWAELVDLASKPISNRYRRSPHPAKRA